MEEEALELTDTISGFRGCDFGFNGEKRGEDGGGRRETSAGNNSDDDDGKTTTAHLRFNHFSHSVLIHLFAKSNRTDQREKSRNSGAF